ncbi:Dehydrogenase reductase SDR member 13 [Terramyces sp. JEL0728]|nr:Dehydrogenase reductase SDR member 13 [Terramyces sp. JEL0728]
MVFNYKPTQDLTGKVAIVTGGSSGIGKVTCFELARLNCTVVIAARNQEKTLPIIEQIKKDTGNDKVEFLHLELDDLKTIPLAVKEFLSKHDKLDLLINNAGIANAGGMTKDGFEITFGTNHLGPYLFTELLKSTIEKTPDARIIIVSSKAHYRGKRYDWSIIKEPNTKTVTIDSYNDSKLANVMYARKLAKELKNTLVFSLHPGVVATDVWRNLPWILQPIIKFFMLSEEQGAMTTLYCALEARKEDNGLYFDDCKVLKHLELADDEEAIEDLCSKSREFAQEHLQN